MKLMELLEQGKKATREGIEVKYVEANGDYIFTDNGSKVYPTFKDLTRNDWHEYEGYKTNFEFEENDLYYDINKRGYINAYKYNCLGIEDEKIENFNCFKNKELAEFIQKKQLLERKLMVFSYLNGASEIDWKNEEANKYYIAIENYKEIKINNYCKIRNNEFGDIYFIDRATCDKAIELYKKEIIEIVSMKIKLGF